VFVSYGNVDLESNQIITGYGGDGGNGGGGGLGGVGGQAGGPGDGFNFGQAGDWGGGGGRGGAAGSGAGGSGGHSVGVFVDQFSTGTLSTNRFSLGLPGLGGLGGSNTVLGPAPDGFNGRFQEVIDVRQ
jgi:hypothetical protein